MSRSDRFEAWLRRHYVANFWFGYALGFAGAVVWGWV